MSLFPYINPSEQASIDLLARRHAQEVPCAKQELARQAVRFSVGVGVISVLAGGVGYVVGGQEGAVHAVEQISYAGVPVLSAMSASAVQDKLKKQSFASRFSKYKKQLTAQVKQSRSSLHSLVDAGFSSSMAAGAFFLSGVAMSYVFDTPFDGERVLFTGALCGLVYSMVDQRRAISAEQEVVACAKELYLSGKGTPNPRD